jgi:WD40 repeat protein
LLAILCSVFGTLIGLMVCQAPASKAGEPDEKQRNSANPTATENSGKLSSVEEPLPEGAIARLGGPRFRHDGRLQFVAFTPDGKLFLAQDSVSLHIRDAVTFKTIRRIRIQENAGQEALTAALSADGKLIAVADGVKNVATIHIFDAATGELRHTIDDVPFLLRYLMLRFSPDGRKLAATSASQNNSSIVLWDTGTGAKALVCNPPSKVTRDFVFTPDGKSVLSGGSDGVIHVWDTATGQLQRDIGVKLDEIGRLCLSPDGSRLASVSMHRVESEFDHYVWEGDHIVRVWDTVTGKLLHRLSVPVATMYPNETRSGFGELVNALNMLVFSPDGKQLLTGDPDREIRVWDVAHGKEVRRINAPGGMPGLMAISPDARRLVVAPLTQQVFWFLDPRGGYKSGRWIYRSRPVRSDWFQVVDFASGQCLSRNPGHCAGVTLSAFSPDSRFVATASARGEVITWETDTGREVQRFKLSGGDATTLSWTDGGRSIVVATTDNTISVRDAKTGKELRQTTMSVKVNVDSFLGSHGKASLAPDGKFLAVVDKGGSVTVTDAKTGKELNSLDVKEGAPSTVSFSSDSRLLNIATTESKLISWNVSEDSMDRQLSVREKGTADFNLFYRPIDTFLSSDGKVLIATRDDGKMTIIDGATEVVRIMLARPNFGETCIAISPDSRMLAWAGGRADPKIWLIDVSRKDEIQRLPDLPDLPDRPGRCLSLAFSPDGKRLISGSEDGTALIWKIKPRP